MTPPKRPPAPPKHRAWAIHHASEKVVEHAGDRFMAMLGFTAIRFSQSRETRQTPGIPDRLYINSSKRLAVFWEAKTEIGKQSASQRAFQTLAESVGWKYLLGTSDVLVAWAREQGLIL